MQRNQVFTWGFRVLLFAFFVLLTYLYTYPGSDYLLQGRTDVMLSDDTDPAPLPYSYDGLIQTWENHPSHMFYGSVYSEGRNPERGMAEWYPWTERWLVILYSTFIPVEQISTALIVTWFMLNALMMFALCRVLTWDRSLSLGLSIAWAFSAYTRARSKVHGTLVGVYHLPMIFLGLLLVGRGKTWKSVVGAAALFLLAATSAHYYVVTCAALSPFFLAFLFLLPEVRGRLGRTALRLSLAAAPAILLTLFCLLNPIPPDSTMKTADAFPITGNASPGAVHPFLSIYAANPLDYFSGDVALGPSDTNPLRAELNEYVLRNLVLSNPHERANGIRWIIWFVILWAVYAIFRGVLKAPRDKDGIRNYLYFFFVLALVAFWLSLPPDIPFANAGLSYWLHELVPQIRVPNRAAIVVHFSLLMITGFVLHEVRERRKKGERKFARAVAWLVIPGVLPLIAIAELPPLLQDAPTAPIQPVIQALQREHGACGAGMYFPFINGYWGIPEFYHFGQQLRGSDCPVLNQMLTPEQVNSMTTRFPFSGDYFRYLQNQSDEAAVTLERLVRCVPLTWVVFDPRTPPAFREMFCRRMGWTLHPDLSCVAPILSAPLKRLPSQCP